MKKNSIEIIFECGFIDVITKAPTIMIIWKNKDGKFFESNIPITQKEQQRLRPMVDNCLIKEVDVNLKKLIINYVFNKETSLEELQKKCKESNKVWNDDLNKKLISYIRNEKLNKLIN